jgi:hypothetical protein
MARRDRTGPGRKVRRAYRARKARTRDKLFVLFRRERGARLATFGYQYARSEANLVILEICRSHLPSFRRIPHQQVPDKNRGEPVLSEQWRLRGGDGLDQVLVHWAILRRDSRSHLHQVLCYNFGWEVRFPAFLRSVPALETVPDKSGLEAALSAGLPPTAKVAASLHEAGESVTGPFAAAMLAAPRPAVLGY